MDKRSLRELKIDRELQSLVVPLSRAQYAQLEADVRAGRCREPLLTWRGCILEEYERYEICARHHIEIPVAETAFKCREAVTAWLCAGQLERTGLTEQTRRCLMGIWLEAEKALNREKYGHPKSKETERRIAARAGVAPASVQVRKSTASDGRGAPRAAIRSTVRQMRAADPKSRRDGKNAHRKTIRFCEGYARLRPGRNTHRTCSDSPVVGRLHPTSP